MNELNGCLLPYSHFSKIAVNLWMGGTPAALAQRTAEFKDFRFIVCLYPWESYELEDHHVYTQVQMYDSAKLPEVDLVTALADYVNAVRKIGPVLVHCQQGWNRSGLVTALALIRSGMEPKQAIALMREKRSAEVLCNPVFEAWLLTQGAA